MVHTGDSEEWPSGGLLVISKTLLYGTNMGVDAGDSEEHS